MAKIVLVEDEQSLRDLLKAILENLGHEVASANNGQQALRLLEQAQPALVISDVMMPVMDGYMLLEHIRLKSKWHSIKVLLISAATINRDGEHQADRYMSKPFNLEELEEVVEELIN